MGVWVGSWIILSTDPEAPLPKKQIFLRSLIWRLSNDDELWEGSRTADIVITSPKWKNKIIFFQNFCYSFLSNFSKKKRCIFIISKTNLLFSFWFRPFQWSYCLIEQPLSFCLKNDQLFLLSSPIIFFPPEPHFCKE